MNKIFIKNTTIFILIAVCFFSLQTTYAKNFKNMVTPYEDYIKQDPQTLEKITGFQKTIQNATPPKLKTKFTFPASITIIYPGNQVSDYWKRSQKSLRKRLQQSELNFNIKSFFTKSDSNINLQEKIINNELKANPDYLIFTLDAIRHQSIIEKIIAKNKTKVIIQNITTPIEEWENAQPFLYVGFDHESGTKKIAEEYIRRTNGKGNYAVFFGPIGYVSQMRGETFIDYIHSNSSLRLAAAYYVDFNREKARNAALDLLSYQKNIDFIYACSTDIALGITDALKELNMQNKIMVNGWGGGSLELQLIESQELTMTIMRINDDNGVAMADAIILDITGQSNLVPLVFSGEMVLITKETPKETIEKFEDQAFRYSNLK